MAGTLRHGKPLHPQGKVGEATLDITVPRPDLGVPIFQRQGERACTVRWSRSVGLPDSWPDFEGMAVRFHDPVSDILFASTGTGVVGRHVLVPRAGHTHGPLTTLLPVSTTAGPLLLALTPVDDGEPPTLFHVSVALEGEEWDRVGLLRVTWGEDREMHFDPVTNQLPGTEQYAVVRAVREPAYLFARLTTPR